MTHFPLHRHALRQAAVAVAIAGMTAVSAPLAHAQPASSSAVPTENCDRNCLETILDRYLEAMIAHDVRQAPLAPTLRFTENGQQLKAGDALWRTASRKGRYRVVMSDPEAGQVGFLGTIYEGETPAILGMRLKVVKGEITEAEHVVGRSKESAAKLDAMAPDPVLTEAVPINKRRSAEELRRIANLYFAGIENGNTRIKPPFTKDCVRLENGLQTTGNAELAQKARAEGRYSYLDLGCAAQFETGYFKIVTEVRDRRFPIVDVERQTVFTFVFFDHRGDVRKVRLADGTEVPVGLHTPFTWEMAELFRMEDGAMHRIEAVLNSVPYRMKSGWPAEAAPPVQ